MKKSILALFVVSVFALSAVASTGGRVTIGGSLGASFSDNNSNINIAPQVGYNFNRFLTLGGGVSYNYTKRDHFSTNYLGAHVFGKFHPIRYINIYVQPELQHRWASHGISRTQFATMLVGGGVVIPTGGRGGVSISIYYDVLQNKYSPYGDKIGYSVGYTFSF